MFVVLKFYDEDFFGKLLEVEQNVSSGHQSIVLRFQSIFGIIIFFQIQLQLTVLFIFPQTYKGNGLLSFVD